MRERKQERREHRATAPTPCVSPARGRVLRRAAVVAAVVVLEAEAIVRRAVQRAVVTRRVRVEIAIPYRLPKF